VSLLAERADRTLAHTDAFAVASALTRLNAEHAHHDHRHAASRTLNLVVLASEGQDGEAKVRAGLDLLGPHHPARTLVLREHPEQRLDAALTVSCSVCADARASGACSDEIVLLADSGRLEHAGSLVAPLLAKDLYTVLWLASGDRPGHAERELRALCDHVVLSSQVVGLARARKLLAAGAPVHDVEWGRLARWRTGIAAAFAEATRRALIPRIDRVVVSASGARVAPWLLAGWIAGRLGWTVESARGHARCADGAPVQVEVQGARSEQFVLLAAGEEELRVPAARPARPEDAFLDAIGPRPSFAAGYATALEALGEECVTAAERA